MNGRRVIVRSSDTVRVRPSYLRPIGTAVTDTASASTTSTSIVISSEPSSFSVRRETSYVPAISSQNS